MAAQRKRKTAGKKAARKKTGRKASARKAPARKTTGRKKAASKKTARKKASTRKYSRGASDFVRKEMEEYNAGTARSGRSGKKVKSREQAIAIGLSEAKKAGEAVPPNPNE